MADFVVSDTGPLISLEKIRDGYKFIRKLHKKIIIPPQVLREVHQGYYPTAQEYLKNYGIEDLIEIRPVVLIKPFLGQERLHEAEVAAITLALQLKCPLLIEETLGRKAALSLGLKISGVAGQVMKAFRGKIIDKAEVDHKLKELLEGKRINQEIYDFLLNNA